MRGVLIGFVIVLLIIAGIAYWAFTSLDSIIEAGIERVGSSLTETEVAVGGVDVDFKNLSITVTGVTIANPKGFSKGPAMTFATIRLAVDRERTTKEVVALREILIDAPVISYEVGAQGSNIDAIAKAVERNTSDESAAESEEDGPKFIIDRLVVTKGEVKMAAQGNKVASSDLPGVTLKNIGAGSGGVTGEELGRTLVAAITDQVAKAVASGALDKLLGPVNDNVKKTFDKLFNR